MDQKLKERLFGALILIAVFVIFIPMVLKDPAPDSLEQVTLRAPDLKIEPQWLEVPDELAAWKQEKQEEEHTLVETASASRVGTSKPVWRVQLATFANQSNAEKLLSQLKAKGFKASLEKVPGHEAKLTWVLVGSEASQAKANQLKTKLQSEYKIKGIVVSSDRSSS